MSCNLLINIKLNFKIYGQALDTDGAGNVVDIFIEKESDVEDLGVQNVDILIVDDSA